MKENLFIINGRKIEIGKIVLDRDVLSVSEKSGEYNFYICVSYPVPLFWNVIPKNQ